MEKNIGKYITKDGIIIDDNDHDSIILYRPTGQFMTVEDTKIIDNKELPRLNVNNLLLKKDEFCCFADSGETYKTKTRTTGYVSNRQGGSVRITKGFTYHSGVGRSNAIRETITETYKGYIYITNQRIVYISQNGESFDKSFNSITTVNETPDGVIIQAGSKTYSIKLDTHLLFMQVFNLIKNKQFGAELPEVFNNPNVKYTTDEYVLKIEAKQKETKRNNIIAVAILIGLIMFSIIIGGSTLGKQSKSNTGTMYKSSTSQDDVNMIAQFTGLGFSNEQAKVATNIIKKIGINVITSIEKTENDIGSIGSYNAYPNKEVTNLVYRCKGNDNTEYECEFLLFVKDNEIIHACYYGYGDKVTYYTKENGVIRKTVHPYVNN